MPQQTWNSQTYANNARFVADLGMPVVEWLKPQPGERILDLGCGDGALTVKLQDFGCQVVGVDASPDLIRTAQSLGLDAHVMDGQALTFETEFDAVFSNAALHWMQRSEQVISGVWQALKPGGRFVGEFGGYGNVGTIHQALMTTIAQSGHNPDTLNPWFFPKPEEYQTQLETAGFTVTQIQLTSRPTPLPTGVRGWLETFANPFTKALPAGDRSAFLDTVIELVQPQLQDAAGQWTADYVRLRFSAIKPEY
ncbi:methyltransferase domain-containing protein [filamentous cyanobacterium LEGE 11480]|uniref:Methyltransferase domain-containing protein n=1 Tax=Romeriopsis navalis LEGE 11480 TaxID=2777977 RepID=A0A928VQT4_9CYAN|nr:class I SAM-dependent methyltransferase [Romeriopsis navalis]MBE9032093.1 methyltransferase domain-containing protein [Romeriopsis navalis LEGE 11480]